MNKNSPNIKKEDRFYTPHWCAKDMVDFFKPSGVILEPCKGEGVFTNIIECEWCEIEQGKDFFLWDKSVDWIISNPPYSIYRKWLQHSFNIADNIVYLVPLRRMVGPFGVWKESYNYGGIVHIRHYGTGTKLGYPTGNAFAAVYWKKGFKGNIGVSFFKSIFTEPRYDNIYYQGMDQLNKETFRD